MKKTLLNNRRDYQVIKEKLYKHFESLDEARHEKFSSLEEALEIGYKVAFNDEMDKKEKYNILYKSIYTVMYQCNQLKRKMDSKQMIMYRNIICGISRVRKENENWIFSILNSTMNILIGLYKGNDKANFLYFFEDTNYYLMDYLLDRRVTTMSDKEREIITNFYKLGEAMLSSEISNIQESEYLSLIMEFFVTSSAYWYINNELDEIEKRRSYITASCLGVTKESYYSMRIGTIIVIKALLSNDGNYRKEELEAKLVELGGK